MPRLVPQEGVEPSRLSAAAFETAASAYSATVAYSPVTGYAAGCYLCPRLVAAVGSCA